MFFLCYFWDTRSATLSQEAPVTSDSCNQLYFGAIGIIVVAVILYFTFVFVSESPHGIICRSLSITPLTCPNQGRTDVVFLF